jgi:hypothetical protein
MFKKKESRHGETGSLRNQFGSIDIRQSKRRSPSNNL